MLEGTRLLAGRRPFKDLRAFRSPESQGILRKTKVALAPLLAHLDAVLNPNEFRVAVHLKAKSGNAEELRQRLLGMLTPTRAEDGCISYELHQVEGSPDEFFFFERWASTEAHHKHFETAHLQDLLAIMPKLVAQPVAAYHLKQIE